MALGSTCPRCPYWAPRVLATLIPFFVSSRSSWRGWILRQLSRCRTPRGLGRCITPHPRSTQHGEVQKTSHAAAADHNIMKSPLKSRVDIDTQKRNDNWLVPSHEVCTSAPPRTVGGSCQINMFPLMWQFSFGMWSAPTGTIITGKVTRVAVEIQHGSNTDFGRLDLDFGCCQVQCVRCKTPYLLLLHFTWPCTCLRSITNVSVWTHGSRNVRFDLVMLGCLLSK